MAAVATAALRDTTTMSVPSHCHKRKEECRIPNTRGPARGGAWRVSRDALDAVGVEDVQYGECVHIRCVLCVLLIISPYSSSDSDIVTRAGGQHDDARAAAHVERGDAAPTSRRGRGPGEEQRVREEQGGAAAPARGGRGVHVEVPEAAGVLGLLLEGRELEGGVWSAT